MLPPAGLLDQLAAQGGLHGQQFTNVGYGATGYAFGGGQPTYMNFQPAVRRISTSPFMALEQNVLRLHGNKNATVDGGVCVGDSGSAAYLNVNGTEVAVGIVTLGGDQRCVANDPKFQTRHTLGTRFPRAVRLSAVSDRSTRCEGRPDCGARPSRPSVRVSTCGKCTSIQLTILAASTSARVREIPTRWRLRS